MPHDLSAPTFELRGAARLHRAASPGAMGWGAAVHQRCGHHRRKRQRGVCNADARNEGKAAAPYPGCTRVGAGDTATTMR